MNKSHFFCLRTNAQQDGKGLRGQQKKEKKRITDVETWRSFSNYKQLVHRGTTGTLPINSNTNLYTAIRASRYNAMYMYICAHTH